MLSVASFAAFELALARASLLLDAGIGAASAAEDGGADAAEKCKHCGLILISQTVRLDLLVLIGSVRFIHKNCSKLLKTPKKIFKSGFNRIGEEADIPGLKPKILGIA